MADETKANLTSKSTWIKLIVIGILQPAFEQYASRLGREVRDEWAKVQGRYVDIPVVTAIDEVIDLVGRAIVTEHAHPLGRNRLDGSVIVTDIAGMR